jgi:hypothetical protein
MEAEAAGNCLHESPDQANDQSRTSFPQDDEDDDDDDDDDDSVLTSANLRTDEDDDSHYEECCNSYSNSEHAYSSGTYCELKVMKITSDNFSSEFLLSNLSDSDVILNEQP